MPNGVARPAALESSIAVGTLAGSAACVLSKALAVLGLLASLAISGSSHSGVSAYHRKGHREQGQAREFAIVPILQI
jgi:hypothetical protein